MHACNLISALPPGLLLNSHPHSTAAIYERQLSTKANHPNLEQSQRDRWQRKQVREVHKSKCYACTCCPITTCWSVVMPVCVLRSCAVMYSSICSCLTAS